MITGYILLVTHIWSPKISQPGWWSQCYMQEWRSMLFSGAWTLSELLLFPVPSKAPESSQSSRLHTARPRAGRKRLKTKYLHCASRKGTEKCSLLGSALCFCTQGYQCSPSPHLHTWMTRKVPTCPSLPAQLQLAGRVLPRLFICLEKGLRKKQQAASSWLGDKDYPSMWEEAPRTAMRKWAPKYISAGLPGLALLQESTFLCTAVMMWGPCIAGARKNKQQLLWIFIALFWESYLSSSSKQSHLNTVAGWDAHEIRSICWTESF